MSELRATATHALSPAERGAIESVLGPPERARSSGYLAGVDGRVGVGGRRARERNRHLLLPVLHALQERAGHLGPAAVDHVATRLDLAPAEVFEVASAYALLRLEPSPPAVVHVCDDIACRASAGGDPCARLADLAPEGEARDGLCWWRSPCLGQCEQGSAAFVQSSGERGGRVTIAPVDPGGIGRLATVAAGALGDTGDTASQPGPGAPPPVPQLAGDRSQLRLLRRVGSVDPASLGSYRAAGGYEALRRAIELGPEAVIRELTDAKLLGRGGAAFPIGTKWAAVARNPVRPHYVVANADESEPGTFKDRVLIEHDPFGLVEAMTIAGLTTGAERGFVYLRGEYPRAEAALRTAIGAARTHGLLGEDVAHSGRRFELELRRGAGAYIAGEETALFASIEGHRPEPRNKPPFPSSVACSASRPASTTSRRCTACSRC